MKAFDKFIHVELCVFDGSLRYILWQIIVVGYHLVPVFIDKVKLTYNYI